LNPELAVVVPVFDEEDSVEPLYREIDAALSSLGDAVEMIWVDDGSRDRSGEILRELDRKDARVRVITLPHNQGQSAALEAGFQSVRAPVTVTLDADLQNDPADIPMLLEHLTQDVDVVNGVRVGRRDSGWKILTSRIANAVRNRLTGESISDVGCSLRVIRTAFLRRIELRGGLHRFLPTLLRLEGARLVEVPVSHRPRRYGKSKYGVGNRLVPALLDLRTVRRMGARARRSPGVEPRRSVSPPRA
jgi:dolichol-phosphate mannosyltransferase